MLLVPPDLSGAYKHYNPFIYIHWQGGWSFCFDFYFSPSRTVLKALQDTSMGKGCRLLKALFSDSWLSPASNPNVCWPHLLFYKAT